MLLDWLIWLDAFGLKRQAFQRDIEVTLPQGWEALVSFPHWYLGSNIWQEFKALQSLNTGDEATHLVSNDASIIPPSSLSTAVFGIGLKAVEQLARHIWKRTCWILPSSGSSLSMQVHPWHGKNSWAVSTQGFSIRVATISYLLITTSLAEKEIPMVFLVTLFFSWSLSLLWFSFFKLVWKIAELWLVKPSREVLAGFFYTPLLFLKKVKYWFCATFQLWELVLIF